MGSSKSKRNARKRSHHKRRGVGTLQQKVRGRLGKEGILIVEGADGVKMSEVLDAFVEPYKEFADTGESFRKLMAIAVVAWNVSLLPKGERREMVEEMLGALPEEARADGRQIVKELVRRKKRHFSEYKRMVIDFEVADTGDGYQLIVASTAYGV